MDARHLLIDGPDGYVAARTAAVKAAKAAKDKQFAAELQALSKPTAALWAVLAAADDEALARDAVAATEALATVQAAGDRAGIVAATKHRKDLVERVIAASVADAGRWGDVPGPRRDEIRRIVERLTRAPEAVDAWVDATLRTLPDDAGGFSAFDGMTLAPPPPRERPTRAAARPSSPEPVAKRPTRPDPAAVRQADRRVGEAERAVASAKEHVARADEAVAAATAQAEQARVALAAAEAELVERRDERGRLDG